MLLLLFACRSIDPAPADLDGLAHYLWQQGNTGDDAVVAEAVVNLQALVGDLEDREDGQLTRLTTEEADLVSPRGDFDPANAAGIYMTKRFYGCSPEQLEKVLVHAAQDELREGTYASYERVFQGDEAAYLAGETPSLGWTVDIASDIIGADYTEKLQGGIRRVETEVGPAWVQITWMTEAAVFANDNNNFWNQDYQLEVYWQPENRETLHLYGMWRELQVFGFSSDNQGVQGQVLGGLSDWDDETAQLCLEGRP